jgi:putative phage-type endonuclease
LGSSDAAVVMGVDPWRTRLDLYWEKVLPVEDDIDNYAMKRGRDLEPHVRALLEERYGLLLEPRNVDNGDIWRASLDAICFDGKHLFEIKCPGEKAHAIALKNKVPDYYIPQLQHQLLVTGLPYLMYVSYKDGDFVMVRVERDTTYIKELKEKETEFWNEHVLKKIPPKKEERDYDDKEDEEWGESAKLYAESRKMREFYEEKEDFARKNLVNMSNGRNSKGHGIRVNKIIEDGRIDYREAYEELKLMITQEDLILRHDLESFRKNPIVKYRITVS